MEAVESLIIFRITRLKKHSSNHWPDWGRWTWVQESRQRSKGVAATPER